MSYICKGKDGNIYDLKLLYIQRAYLPAITVCNQSLFKQTFVPTAPLPSVTNFVLESNGLVTSFSWTPNATYTTYSEYKIMYYAKYRPGDIIYIIKNITNDNINEAYITNSIYYDKIYTL
jgi:hypothetical protein